MTVTRQVRLKFVMYLSTAAFITESQIRTYLSDFGSQATTWITNTINSAQPADAATLDSIAGKGKVNNLASGEWEVYPKPILTVTVADSITRAQAHAFLRGFFDDAKTKLRNLIAGTPPGAQAVITGWHVHSIDVNGIVTSTNEMEP